MLKLITHLKVVNGVAELAFPDAFIREHYRNSIILHGIYTEPTAYNEELILVTTTASVHYMSLDRPFQPNVIGFLEPHRSLSALHESLKPIEAPLNANLDRIQIYFINSAGTKANIQGHIIVEIRGVAAPERLI